MGETIKTVGDLAGICGHDGTNWEKALIDGSKRLVVSIANTLAALEVTQDTPGDLLTGIHGHVEGAWQKLPLLWGYSNTYSERVFDFTLPAGNSLIQGSEVPTGEVWVVKSMAYYCVSATITLAMAYVRSSGVSVVLDVQQPPTSSQWYFWNGDIPIKAGDYVGLWIETATLNDDAEFRVGGYKMDIDL